MTALKKKKENELAVGPEQSCSLTDFHQVFLSLSTTEILQPVHPEFDIFALKLNTLQLLVRREA